MRTGYGRADRRSAKNLLTCAFPGLWAQRIGVSRFWEELRNRLLEPWNDFGHGRNGLFRQKTVHLVAQPQIHSTVPKPTDLYIDFAVVDLLEFDSQIPIVSHNIHAFLPIA